MDISCSIDDHGVAVERSFFGSAHGKGPCDGVGATTKSALRQAVLLRKVCLWKLHLGTQCEQTLTECKNSRALIFLTKMV